MHICMYVQFVRFLILIVLELCNFEAKCAPCELLSLLVTPDDNNPQPSVCFFELQLCESTSLNNSQPVRCAVLWFLYICSEHILTCYVCSLCLLLIAPLILLSALPSQVHLGLPCAYRIAQPRGIAHTQIELIHTCTNSFNLNG